MSDGAPVDRPRRQWTLNATGLDLEDQAIQQRLNVILHEANELAKQQAVEPATAAVAAEGSEPALPLERLIHDNREQTAQIETAAKDAAQREALIGQLQAQLAQSRLQMAQMLRDGKQAQEQLVAQHTQMTKQVQEQYQQRALDEQRLGAATHSFAAYQVEIQRLNLLMSQSYQLLQSLADRCASQQIELPSECASALALLQRGIAGNSVGECRVVGNCSGRLPPSPGLQILAEASQKGDVRAFRPLEDGRMEMDDVYAYRAQGAPSVAGASYGRTFVRATVRATPIAAAQCSSDSRNAPQDHEAAPPLLPAARNSAAPCMQPFSSQGGDHFPAPTRTNELPARPPSTEPSPGQFGGVTPSLPFSPSMFCTLLSSPDLQQLMSPKFPSTLGSWQKTPGLVAPPSQSSAAVVGLASETGSSLNGSKFAQYRRRPQQNAGLPSDMVV
uniref:Uncharacterized protein n=1 Tax=Haptolina ericina TaxID=156174 RepID=A0A7S3ATE0_9EUKA|mmetsp:Transcript_34774/g.78855  ORF Transcript_34774/g.78855 Transcript_34774/m.78855 type:complete len:445 (+) Transcript_34774:61-1395(+)